MNCNLVLISPAEGPTITDKLYGEIIAPIPRAHRSNHPNWLSADKACDTELLAWDGSGDAAKWTDKQGMLDYVQREVVEPARTHHGIDAAVILSEARQNPRRKKLLVADMDSTIINQECIDVIADFAGVKDKVAAITERAMRGELEFDGALRERVGLLKGLDETLLQRVFDERITLMPGARTLVKTMQAHGARCALVSGGFTFFTSRVGEAVGFDTNQANVLGITDGRLDGTVAEPILGRQAKLDALTRLTKENNLDAAQTLAIGDGANDLAMIKAAGLGVAYRAKPVVAAEAAAAIAHGDLTALLYLQGYSRNQLAED